MVLFPGSQILRQIGRCRVAGRHSLRQAFQTDKQDVEGAEESFQKADQTLNLAQQACEASQAEFDQVEEQYRAVLAERETKMESYNIARTEEIKAQAQFDALKEREEELRTVKTHIDELSKTLTS